MIRSFGNNSTEDFYHGRRSAQSRKVPSAIRGNALRKLDMLNAATAVQDLRSPPREQAGEAERELEGFHSVRINQQWRLIFRWVNGGAEDVEIIDYHR